MSYDLCELKDCFYTDPHSPLRDSSIDIFKTFQETNYNLNPFTNEILDTPSNEIDQIAPITLSSSTPCHHLQSLSNYQITHSLNYPHLCHLDIKTEQNKQPFYDYQVDFNSLLPHSYDGWYNSVKMMETSLIESSHLQSLNLTSPDHGFSSNFTRRVCSTGDLQSMETKQTLSSSSLATKGSIMEESNFKVCRYGPEERKERILRYKAKRTQRNFNKTIKYACRKTLADNRPRIRGRFARNDDEPEETLKAFNFQRYEDEYELLMDGLQEEYNEGIPRGHFINTYMPITQFHQYSNFPRRDE